MKISCLLILCVLMIPSHGIAQKKNADYYFQQGQAAMEDNKYTLALAHVNECLRQDPYYWEAYALRASAKERLGDAKGALTDFNIYIDRKPGDPEALIGRAVLRYQLGQYEPAKEDFLKLLKSPPQETSKVIFRQSAEGTDKMYTIQGSNHADFLSYLGLIEMRLKAYSQAKHYLDSAISIAPKEPHYYVNRGMVREHVLDTTGAITDYMAALQLDPGDGEAMHNLAAIKRAKGEQAESENLLDAAILQSPNLPTPYEARAWFRFSHQNYKGALEDYDKSISINQEDEESWLYRGMVKEKLKDLDGAFVDFTQAISLKNDYARAWMARGTLLTRLKRIPEAIEDYSVAILWYPEFGLAWYNRGIAQQKVGKLKEACEDLRKAESLQVKVDAEIKGMACK